MHVQQAVMRHPNAHAASYTNTRPPLLVSSPIQNFDFRFRCFRFRSRSRVSRLQLLITTTPKTAEQESWIFLLGPR